MLWLDSTPNMRKNTLVADQGLPTSLPLPPISRVDLQLPHPFPRRYYTLTNTHAISEIRTLDLREQQSEVRSIFRVTE
ncbi:hypothetical protein TNCV_3073921 [Trichonephila clavipes]|nr:hypothetical protein TNCV_3073921 [Trichonephila clavipes]